MKRTLRFFASITFVRYFVRSTLAIFVFFERIYSNFKYRAYVKDCSNSICHYTTEIKYGERIKVGKNTRIGPKCTLGGYGGLTIGDNVVISKNVTIETAGLDLNFGPPFLKHKANPIKIGNNVWIGTNCTILGNVTIGDNVIIGAGTVVAKSISNNKVVVGGAFRTI